MEKNFSQKKSYLKERNEDEQMSRLIRKVEAGDIRASIEFLAKYGDESYRMSKNDLRDFLRQP